MAPYLSATDFILTATETARYFGFKSLNEVKKDPECSGCKDRIKHTSTASHRRIDALHGMLTSGMCSYFDSRFNGINGPVLFYSVEQVPRSAETAITLQIFNVKKSIAEAILIQTIHAILNDVDQKNHCVRINSLGDTESVTRYIRELTHFLRKRVDDMPAPARELMKEHVFLALMHLVEKEHDLARRSPNPLEYLSDQSRKHFREIVEYLDMSNTAYEIDPKLIGHHDCYSDALFAFDLLDENGLAMEESPLYIRGGRYNTFVSKMSKTDTSAAGAVLVLRNKKLPSRLPRQKAKLLPPVFMVQLGFGPKIKSLLLIDEFRKAGIPVHQNIVSDSLSEQLGQAASKFARYAVILGHKEYMEGNAILRNLEAQNQESVPLTMLTDRLKKIVLA